MDLVTTSNNDIWLPIHRITQVRGMECWYAAAAMVLGYRNKAVAAVATSSNMETLFRLFANAGLRSSLVQNLAIELGLSSTMRPPSPEISWYAQFLRRNGPIWVWVQRPWGAHIVVLCGVKGNELLFADPDRSFGFPLAIDKKSFEGPAVTNSGRAIPAVPVLFKR
jgi:ABC-type bacteriocin/lantibiotic exporter with double-glycine peptidase domain